MFPVSVGCPENQVLGLSRGLVFWACSAATTHSGLALLASQSPAMFHQDFDV